MTRKSKKEVTACSIVADAMGLSEDEVERIYREQMKLRDTDPLVKKMQDEMEDHLRKLMEAGKQ